MSLSSPPSPAPRSLLVTRVAWTFIVLAALGALLGIVQAIAFFTAIAPLEPAGGGSGALASRVLVLAFPVLSLAALFVAVALLRRRRWARPAFVAMLVLGIAGGMASLGAGLLYPANLPSREEGEGPFLLGRIAFIGGFAFTALCALAFAWLILRFSRRSIRDEFESR